MALESLLPGECLRIDKADWKSREKSPAYIVRRVTERTGMRFTLLKIADGTGWLAERTK